MVEVEDTPHEKERQVMESPAQEQPASAEQEVIDRTCIREMGSYEKEEGEKSSRKIVYH